jgi:hypothetical protein
MTTKKQNPYLSKLPLTNPIQTPYTKKMPDGNKWFIADIQDYQTQVVTKTTLKVILRKHGSDETKIVSRQITKTTPQGRPNNVDTRRVRLAKRHVIDQNWEFSPGSLMGDIKANFRANSPAITIYKSSEEDEDSSEEIELSEPLIEPKTVSNLIPSKEPQEKPVEGFDKFFLEQLDKHDHLENWIIETLNNPQADHYYKMEQREFDALMRLRNQSRLSNDLTVAINTWFLQGKHLDHFYYHLYSNCAEPTD